MAALLAAEAGLRFLLFSDQARRSGVGWQLRNAGLYAPHEAGEDYWKLRARLGESDPAQPALPFDARFGWLKPTIDPATFAHDDEPLLRGRRPVVLFGDSYAQCAVRPCWGAWLDQSPLSEQYRLLNYGVGGFGLDQTVLLMGPVLDRLAGLAPVVVIGILVDDDLDRCDLGFRIAPKPRFVAREGGLELRALEHATAPDYLRAHPPEIRSYLWRWLLFGSGLVPHRLGLSCVGEAHHVERKEAVSRLLLTAIRDDLEARGLPYFFLLFHARPALEVQGPYGWQEPFLYATFRELGASFVSSKRFLRAYLERTGSPVECLYRQTDPGRNHYTPLGNEVVSEALREGLLGRFEPFEYLAER